MDNQRVRVSTLVIGSGIAGCTAALQLAYQGQEVTLLTAGSGLDDGNTALAQGGIVYRSEDDDPSYLESDILKAGWDYNYRRAVRYLSRRGPKVVKEFLLERIKIPFDRDSSDVCRLVREGGHSKARILYCADFTGRAIMQGLQEAVLGEPHITVLTKRTAIDLLTSYHHSERLEFKYHLDNQAVGAYVYNGHTGEVQTILADHTVLATGGLGQIFLHTTNTAASIGSGLAMSFRAGAMTMNTEFVQFHPTALYQRGDWRFLISEAVRGEGARLVNEAGEPFMQWYDERGDLAPRDVVTRAIVDEMLTRGEECVFLDAANHVDLDLKERFPTIYRKCRSVGIDITKDPIPVVPAAHYSCGGVLVNIHGQTTLPRLYAAGECTCTGVHGANRLASTSLLEALLWGWSAARDIGYKRPFQNTLDQRLADSIPDWVCPGYNHNEDPALIAQDWATIRNTMWNYVGITRTTPRLKRAFEDLRALNKRIHDFYRETPISKPLIDLFHGCQAAYVVTNAALRNKQSIGCHYRQE
ncbi:L-aspartate oxidase [Desulfohalobium retbaense]|uniref:L-aspartate oxidase n=1 Tax=Desulfohalobium retbaense (strain ATCC 49708 / DSM 5692 / JCM 16813 / HR100) TaxID=485915 RepID=C8X2L4_DESRD|nr:L-aspartate oxidase [Desulfohalobium retbaense]ACV68661.1 L-aspartate oxidase [Desulfohalobium retbaense DSM 5692]